MVLGVNVMPESESVADVAMGLMDCQIVHNVCGSRHAPSCLSFRFIRGSAWVEAF